MLKTLDFTLKEIAYLTQGTMIGSNQWTRINSISTDSRSITSRETLFVALKGPNFDGHKFIEAAQRKGAIVALVEDIKNTPFGIALIQVDDTYRAYGRLARARRDKYDIPVVAVTGSYGKTTTRQLISQVLSESYEVTSTTKNHNNEVGVPETLLKLEPTHQAAVVEMGMRGLGQIDYLTDLARPTDGIITNIGPQHIEFLGSLDNVAKAKAELLQALPDKGTAVLPADDQYLSFLIKQCPRMVSKVTFGEQHGDWRAQKIQLEPNGDVSFTAVGPNGQQQLIQLPLKGRHNAINALAAIAFGYTKDISLQDMATRLLHTPTVPCRLEESNNKHHDLIIIDDTYNAGPNSMRVALSYLREKETKGQKVAILGTMNELGPRSEEFHQSIGKYASQCCDVVVAVEPMGKWYVMGCLLIDDVHWFDDIASVLNAIESIVRDGSTILVKGSNKTSMGHIVSFLKNLK